MLFNGGVDDDDNGALVEPTNLRGRTRFRGADASAMDGEKSSDFDDIMSTDLDNDTDRGEKKRQIYLTVPPRLLVLPPAFFIVGSLLGFIRGTRSASLKFLAENAHRPPRTLQGWYFYNKTKNYIR